jgi:hypothetical protein
MARAQSFSAQSRSSRWLSCAAVATLLGCWDAVVAPVRPSRPPVPSQRSVAAPASAPNVPSATPASTESPTVASTDAPPAVRVDVPLVRSARLLAGLDVDPAPSVARDTATLQRRRLRLALDQYESSVGRPMQQWAAHNLSSAKGETVFYPFSGPDFITVHRFYPEASRYVLVALQEGGAPPVVEALDDRIAAAMLSKHALIIENFARRGFFITKQMGLGFVVSGIWRGIAGTLMAFAALEGYEVVAAAPIRIRADGEIETLPAEPREMADWSSLRLTLMHGNEVVLLDYLDLDLSNDSLLGRPAFTRLLERVSGSSVVIKAASHLPQWPSFSMLREMLLERSREIVQDETGLRYVDLQQRFDVRLFGRFIGVNPLFDGRPQYGLKLAYEQRTDVQPLGFSIGYRKAGGSCLQVARRK